MMNTSLYLFGLQVHLLFSDFIKFCQQNSRLINQNDLTGAEGSKEVASVLSFLSSNSTDDHLYLAQVIKCPKSLILALSFLLKSDEF